MMPRGCRLPIALALTIGAASAHAQTKPAPPAPSTEPSAQVSPDDSARRLFEEGTADLTAGRFAGAAEKLRAAWDKKKSYDIAGNLGAALLKLAQHAEAARFLSLALRDYPVGAKPSVKQWLAELLGEAKNEVVTLQVQVSAGDAAITVNGEPAGKSPLTDEIYVTPGKIVVAATKEGFEPARAERQGEKGRSIVIALPLVARGQAEPSPERPKWPAFVGGGVVLALAGAGIGFAAAAGDNASAADKKLVEIRTTPNAGPCPAEPAMGLCSDLGELNRAHDQLRNVSIGLFVGAAVITAATVAYTVWAVNGPARVGMVVGPQRAGLVIQGSF